MYINPVEGVNILSKFTKEFKSLLKGITTETSNAFEVGLSKYINDRHKKISKINTFLSRTEKVNFYDVFFSLTLKSSKRYYDSNLLSKELFIFSNTVGIIGSAGSGKTILLKHIFLSCKNELDKIPIYIELRDLNNYDYTLTEYIYSVILENKIKPSTKILERSLNIGKYIFLFDGFDELSIDKKDSFLIQVESFIDINNKNHFVFSSRPGTSIESLPRLISYDVQPLNKVQIELFVKQQLSIYEDNEFLERKIIDSINDEENEAYLTFLSNPLLLSMFILTFNSYPELPRLKSKFYWNVFDTLANRHDSFKKGGYAHEKKSRLQQQEIENVLKAFCVKSLFDGHYNFDRNYLFTTLTLVVNKLNLKCEVDDLIYDLSVSLSLIVQDGLEYKFPHRTIQDYFAVLFIKEQNFDAKQKIYKSRVYKMFQDVNANLNFLDLCFELDRECFYEYLILDILNEINRKYNGKNSIEKIARLAKDIDLKFVIHFNDDIAISYTVTHNSETAINILYYFRKHLINFIDLGKVNWTNISNDIYKVLTGYTRIIARFKSGDDKKLYNLAIPLKQENLEDLKLIIHTLSIKEKIYSLFNFFRDEEIEISNQLNIERENKSAMWDL